MPTRNLLSHRKFVTIAEPATFVSGSHITRRSNLNPEDRRKYIPTGYREKVSEGSSRVLALWANGSESWLIHKEIVDQLVKQGMRKRTAVRAIKRVLDEGKLERHIEGSSSKYRPVFRLKDFDFLEYLSNLHAATSKFGMVHDWDVGGWLSHAAAGVIVGFPPVEMEKLQPDESLALNTILVRIAELYSALMDLRDVLLVRRAGAEVNFSDDLLRQVLLECHVRVLDKTMGRTDSIIEKLGASFGDWSVPARQMFDRNSPERVATALDSFPISLNLVHSFSRLLHAKKHLRKQGFNIDRHSIAEISAKLRHAQLKMDQFSDKFIESAIKKKRRDIVEIPVPERMNTDLSLLSAAYSVKLAEIFSKSGLRELQDMALVVTRHPNTMETQMTTERMLSEFIEMMKEFRQEKMSGLSEEQLAKFLGREFGESHYRLDPDEVDDLKDKPWLNKELGVHGPAFFKEYHLSRADRIKFEKKRRRWPLRVET